MSQIQIELILMRQIATYLAVPMFLIDKYGVLLFYNEAAEQLLGKRFDETGSIPMDVVVKTFAATDERGVPLPAEELPVYKAVMTGKAVHRQLWFIGADGVRRGIEATGFPLIGISREVLGGVAIFWEIPAYPATEGAPT